MTTENIRAHNASVRKTGAWTTARRFDVRASRGSVVLDLLLPRIEPGDIEIQLDIDHSMVKLLVPDGANIESGDLRRIGRGRVKDWTGTGRPGGRTIRLRRRDAQRRGAGAPRRRRHRSDDALRHEPGAGARGTPRGPPRGHARGLAQPPLHPHRGVRVAVVVRRSGRTRRCRRGRPPRSAWRPCRAGRDRSRARRPRARAPRATSAPGPSRGPGRDVHALDLGDPGPDHPHGAAGHRPLVLVAPRAAGPPAARAPPGRRRRTATGRIPGPSGRRSRPGTPPSGGGPPPRRPAPLARPSPDATGGVSGTRRRATR